MVEPFPEPGLLADLLAAHPVVMAYEAARQHAEDQRHRAELSAPLLELLDVGASTPDAPGPAPRGRGSTGDPVLSRPWQALGLPAVAVPGLRAVGTGLPLGVQLIGKRAAETDLLRVGCWAEAVLR